jgi:hypothetical protein
MNCIQEGIIPTKYYEKTTEKLHQASGIRLNIEYKISNAHICNNGICFKTTFILVKNITSKIILGNPFLALLDSFIKTEEGISTEIMRKKILFKFILPPITKDIKKLKNIFIFQEINVISKQIRDRKYHESNFNFTSFSINDALIFSKYISLIVSFIGINLFCKILENLNFVTNALNGKYLTLQNDIFFISGIMTAKRIQNLKRLTPAEKRKAKVNEYKEFPAEIQQKNSSTD